ncbi:LOW QUALITY PROTEIN: hypothetical protein PHMEG_00031010, partial [Phytophthora megakarya]
INTVIVLDESVRFRNDPEWGAGCSLARLGQWTPEFIDLVNSRVLKTPHHLQQQQHEQASQLDLRDEITPEAVSYFRKERPTEVIELLKSALKDGTQWTPPVQTSSIPSPLRAYSSIAEVSQAFTLNHRQHVAFTRIATSLLKRYLHQELGGINAKDGIGRGSHATLMIVFALNNLGGAGGTGKSRVIDAIHAFSASWHRDDAVEKAALTGKAATLIGGRTLASFMMRLKHAVRNKHFMPLDLLVIDEVSMMSKSEWLKLDKALRQYKQLPTMPFGGVHIVLVGDWIFSGEYVKIAFESKWHR